MALAPPSNGSTAGVTGSTGGDDDGTWMGLAGPWMTSLGLSTFF
jgi:hypothetical protein